MSNTLEEWRPVAGLEGRYEVSSFGQVRSVTRSETHVRQGKPVTCLRRGRILKTVIGGRGYLTVKIGSIGRQKSVAVHSLVAHAFLPTCPGDYGVGGWNVDHINDNKLDNRAENLQWLPHWDNCFIKSGGKARTQAQVSKQARNADGRFT